MCRAVWGDSGGGCGPSSGRKPACRHPQRHRMHRPRPGQQQQQRQHRPSDRRVAHGAGRRDWRGAAVARRVVGDLRRRQGVHLQAR
ncbi:hypothetical protein ACFPRL_03055 [Pseudoclavibacter helvolus]